MKIGAVEGVKVRDMRDSGSTLTAGCVLRESDAVSKQEESARAND